MFWNVALVEKGDFFRVEAEGEVIENNATAIFLEVVCVVNRGESVIVRYKIKTLVTFILKGDVLANGAQVIPDVRTTGGFNSRKNTHLFFHALFIA